MHMVIRAPCGGGFSSNECHQKMNEAEWAHAGGFKIIFPATAYAAKGLLATALLKEKNPIIFGEQISNYGKKDIVPEELYFLPIGKARIARQGNNVSIVTYGALMVERVIKAAELLSLEGISAEIIDLQTIVPMDNETIILSATKTEKVLIVHEAKSKFGVGAEINRLISDFVREVRNDAGRGSDLYLKDFYIKTKILGAKDGPVTAHPALEKLRLPQVEDIVGEVKELLL